MDEGEAGIHVGVRLQLRAQQRAPLTFHILQEGGAGAQCVRFGGRQGRVCRRRRRKGVVAAGRRFVAGAGQVEDRVRKTLRGSPPVVLTAVATTAGRCDEQREARVVHAAWRGTHRAVR